jgi:hypothetical protein
VIRVARYASLALTLATVACGFKAQSGDTAGIDLDFRLTYSRPAPGHVNVSYHALRVHELQQLCVFLLKPKRPAPLSLQSLGWIRATPDACWLHGTAALSVGEERRFSHDFPRTDVVFDSRKDMRVAFRVVFQRGGGEPLERFLYP